MSPFFSAAVVAIALQLDTVNVINRLAMDDEMRAAFVEVAVKLDNDESAKSMALKSKAEAGKLRSENVEQATAETDKAKQEADTKKKKEYLVFLANQGLIHLPTSFTNWRENWIWNNGRGNVSIPGVFLSILLLSLGAPFWYNVLGKLLQLRSLLAQKDDDQKNIRQTTQAPVTTSQQKPDNPTSPNPLQGERGDLNAVG